MSEIKVNKISPRTACGTVTLGDSGDTFTIPAGATITNNGTAAGFGATGAASWDTTVKTGDFTAVNGVGYFVNTTSGEIDVTLPAGTAGDVIAISDYANNFATANCILVRNGSDKIGGNAANATLVIDGAAVTLVFVDATKGWIVTDSGNQSEASQLVSYITATGGTATTCGDYKIHTFTGPGTFCVSCAGNAAGSNTVDYLVVAGAGSAGEGVNTPDYRFSSGGGGAGGFRYSATTYCSPASAPGHPLRSTCALTVTVQGYAIAVGGGGPAGAPGGSYGTNGSNSSFNSIVSTGGGRGGIGGCGIGTPGTDDGAPGGSGGGGGAASSGTVGGTGNTPTVNPSQGKDGGGGICSGYTRAGGGGGAVVAGTNAGGMGAPVSPYPTGGGFGGAGAGIPTAFGSNGVPCGSFRYYSGGGGGGAGYTGGAPGCYPGGLGGLGGGGNGSSSVPGTSGTINTGGGAGGTSAYNGPNNGGAGGSGIVVIRYKFQN